MLWQHGGGERVSPQPRRHHLWRHRSCNGRRDHRRRPTSKSKSAGAAEGGVGRRHAGRETHVESKTEDIEMTSKTVGDAKI